MKPNGGAPLNKTRNIVLALIALLVFLCICLVIICAGSFFLIDQNGLLSDVLAEATQTPVVIRPNVVPTNEMTTDDVGEQEMPTIVPYTVATETLQTLEDTIVPVNDLIDLAERLKGKKNIPLTVAPPAVPYQVGTEQSFWLSNQDTNENFQVNTVLQYVTDHVYFWVEDGVSYDAKDMKRLVDTFENKIYPKDREFFGSEWTPGVDGDPHIYILYVNGVGSSVAGYFSSVDEYSNMAHAYSNQHELFILSAEHTDLSDEFTYGVLAHEFQHMIHWHNDRNETTWMNEGFSELASLLNGYDVGGFDVLFAMNPDMQVNVWPNDPDRTAPHYGGAFLFLTYFLDRFGEDATKALVSSPENGLKSIDDVLDEIGAEDPLTGKKIHADDIFMDWATTLAVHNKAVMDGRYWYNNYPNFPNIVPDEKINRCPTDYMTHDVHQYGIDYYKITCEGKNILHFEGSTIVNVVPSDPHSGKYAFWSNKGSESDMTLTRTFDFRNQTGPLTLQYWTWYDIEEDYDYVYLEASEDGEQWTILKTPSGTSEDPSGNSYGWGYTGVSNDNRWIQESVDLSAYAGKKVMIRFEYVTDAAVNGEGFLLDDVRIKETGYSTDFETDDSGWDASGFVRIRNVLPQTFGVMLVEFGKETTVRRIDLSADNAADIPIEIGGDVRSVGLIIVGTTRYTRVKASYRFEIQP